MWLVVLAAIIEAGEKNVRLSQLFAHLPQVNLAFPVVAHAVEIR